MEAVEITISARFMNTRTGSTALDRSKLLTPAVLDQVKKLSNSIVKVKKEKELSLESVVYRLNAVGLDSYPISLSDEIKRTTFERAWLSKHYGGAPQGGSPSIDRKQFKHDMVFQFFDYDFNPHLPKNPGDPGLTFYGVGEADEWGPDPEDIFVRLKPKHWFYIGMYRMFVSKLLTAEEWTQQSTAFKNLWCRTIRKSKGKGSRSLRILAHLCRRLGREPTAAERNKALHSGNDPDIELTNADIEAGFQRGTVKVAVWAMKCVGYRDDLQRNIAGRVPTGWAHPIRQNLPIWEKTP
ncbi:hypothetical protein B0H16DRAFT_861019 [Mycena metata]|uniref:DUF6697 domain-containing protein n=1 Tax=Mycena metata TaxID=1033252 RepID=A0AAD7DMH5_9AGAR|nr:hypothetical protein B0H16DRAFT_861019 [Mycena metata]